RSKRDWSSDVCSSDLSVEPGSAALTFRVLSKCNPRSHVYLIVTESLAGNFCWKLIVDRNEYGAVRSRDFVRSAASDVARLITVGDRKSTRLNSSHVSI